MKTTEELLKELELIKQRFIIKMDKKIKDLKELEIKGDK